MGRNIVSEYRFDASRTATESLGLAEAAKAQLVASESFTLERKLVVIDSWARALGDAWQDFDKETSDVACGQIHAANQVLKSGLEREMFWGALQASAMAGSEEENGDNFVATATVQYLKNFAEWGYQGSVDAGITAAALGNAFQWVPTPLLPQARACIEAWANGAPQSEQTRILDQITGEIERLHNAVKRWNGGLPKATTAIATEWAKRGLKKAGRRSSWMN